MPDDSAPDEILSQGYDIADSAAIVCKHVVNDGLPIRLARRDEPVHDVDTGWQFHCDVEDHSRDDSALVVAVREVVALDPSVLPILDNPPRTAFRRESPDANWSPEPYENE
jgi:hypothetical protein